MHECLVNLNSNSFYKKLRYREEHSASVVFVGVLYYISGEKICGWLINHFYVIGPKATKFGEITQNKSHYVVKGHSRSPILVPIEALPVQELDWLILSDWVDHTIVSSFVWTKYRNVTDRLTDTRTNYYSCLHCEKCGRAVKTGHYVATRALMLFCSISCVEKIVRG